MKLTEKLKGEINAMPYQDLLRRWRFSPAGGDPIFQGESGAYFAERMKELRSEPGGQDRHVAASKAIERGS